MQQNKKDLKFDPANSASSARHAISLKSKIWNKYLFPKIASSRPVTQVFLDYSIDKF